MHLGTDEVLERRIAVKVLKPEFQDSDVGARFRREGRTAARLSHPNIVQVYDAGEDDLDGGRRVSYIVMEHVSGGDLREKIAERGTLSDDEISSLSGIAAGLAHAHARGVVHRDIKPHNILMDENGQPKLTDFGIARALDATQFTQTGMYLGTARYSSPEQLQGHETTAKSDVYSLGVTLYEAVTGAPPFSGTPIEIATQHVSKPPTPPGEIMPTDSELGALILDCLAKNPDDRPDADEVGRRLKELTQSSESPSQYAVAGAMGSDETGSPTDATRAAPAGRGGTAGNRTPRWIPAAVGIFVILALLGAIGAYALLGEEDRAAQAPATTTQESAPQTTPQNSGPDTVAEPAPPPATTAQTPVTTAQATPQQEPNPNPEPQPGNESEQAAEVTREVYRLAAAGDYGASYDLLSQNFKQNEAQTQAEWANTFDTLEQISFVEGPDVQVSGDTAQASGVTRAVHTDRTERNTVTWTLVREGSGWKLDAINPVDRQIVS